MKNEKRPKAIRKKMDGIFLILVGGAVGSILGFAIAPKSGRETRREISRKTEEIGRKVSVTVGDVIGERKRRNRFWRFLNRLFYPKK